MVKKKEVSPNTVQMMLNSPLDNPMKTQIMARVAAELQTKRSRKQAQSN